MPGNFGEELIPRDLLHVDQRDVFRGVGMDLQLPQRRRLEMTHAVVARNAHSAGTVAQFSPIGAEDLPGAASPLRLRSVAKSTRVTA